MSSTARSSLTRYRPAILALTGAVAAYITYTLITSTSSPPNEGLHRSNAIRRPNARPRNPNRNTARILHRLQNDAPPLGVFDFFGNIIILDARHAISATALREIAHQSEPSASPEMVQNRIDQLCDTFLDRLLGSSFPDRALSAAETHAVYLWISHLLPDGAALPRAIERHDRRFAVEEAEAALTADGAESVALTDMSWRSDEDTEGGVDPEGQTLQRTLYHIAEDRARQEGVIHRGITCNGCDTKPIRGIRWRCANCPDFDLCSDCEATNSHIKTHVFYKIRVPAPYLGMPKQEPVYPGRPHAMSPSVNSSIKRRLVKETKMEAEEIEALWDQFTCLAATEWESDPNQIGWALDRRAFNHAFIPRYSSFISAPNLIYDRVFAYFDTDHNGFIGFEEFIKGLDGMHSTDTRVKLRIVFNGYDVDGDGYISRKDVLRIFRAHYAIEREATRNYLAESAEELSVRGALETIHSSQPLGSAFTQNSIRPRDAPSGPPRKPTEDEDYWPPLRDDVPDEIDREEMIRKVHEESFNDTSRSRNADEAVRERWARRQFYTDEEEGFTRPEGMEDEPSPEDIDGLIDGAKEDEPTLEPTRPRGSRSSSRVRFEDDVDVETRSNASTSSRPIGERWGGYEIPEPEKDLGKEVMYQLIQQAFNELLDPLFQTKEDNAMDAFATRAERRTHAAEIDSLIEEYKREKDINRSVTVMGVFCYVNCVVHSFCKDDMTELLKEVDTGLLSQEDVRGRIKKLFDSAEHDIVHITKSWDDDWEPHDLAMWNTKLVRTQLLYELEAAVLQLIHQLKWHVRHVESSPAPSEIGHESSQNSRPGEEHSEEESRHDPTMPQFRPNSLADLEPGPIGSTPTPSDSASEISDIVINPPGHLTSLTPIFVLGTQGFANESGDSGSEEKGKEGDRPTHTPPRTPTPPPSPPTPPTPPTDETLTTQLPSPGASLSLRTNSVTNDPTLHLLFITPSSHTLHSFERSIHHLSDAHSRERDPNPTKDLEQRIRRIALDATSPLHMPFLASLQDAVEKEIEERKASGVLSFEEFESVVREGRVRFLESWMDWVSF